MSLVATIVRAQDGKYYENPVVRGDDWHIIFDDDDPPEFVWHTKLMNKKLVREKLIQVLTELDLKYSNISVASFSTRSIKGVFSDAASLFFELKSPIPVPVDGKEVAVKDFGEAVIYTFGDYPWERESNVPTN